MKGYLFVSLFLSILFSCKTEESGNEGNSSPVRFDGVYIAVDPDASVVTQTQTGKPNRSRKALMLLRFYNATSGVMVPDHIDTSVVSYNDSITRMFYNWCKDFTKKNPGDTGYVNFKYKYAGDSIWFEQKAPEFTDRYSGKNFNDSLSFVQTMVLKNEEGRSADIHRRYNFIFHKVDN